MTMTIVKKMTSQWFTLIQPQPLVFSLKTPQHNLLQDPLQDLPPGDPKQGAPLPDALPSDQFSVLLVKNPEPPLKEPQPLKNQHSNHSVLASMISKLRSQLDPQGLILRR